MIVEYSYAARQAVRPTTRAQVLRGGWIAIGLGVGFIAVGVLVVRDMVLTGQVEIFTAIMLIPLFAAGVFFVALGPVTVYRAWRSRVADAVAGYTYAFAVADGVVCFPASGLVPAESWSLDQTTVSETQSDVLGTAQLELATPDSEARTFPLVSLKLSAWEILSLIEGERAAPAPAVGANLAPATGDFAVGLNPWTHETVLSGVGDPAQPSIIPMGDAQQLAVRRNTRIAWMCFIGAAAALVLLAVGAVTGAVSVKVAVGSLIGVAVVVLVGAANLLLVRMARAKRLNEERAAQAVLGGEYAFRVVRAGAVDVVFFDAGFGLESEQWPLAETTIQAVRADGEYGVELRSPGRTPRRFSAGALQLSPQTVVALVDSRR